MRNITRRHFHAWLIGISVACHPCKQAANHDYKFALITSLYNEKKAQRAAEYITCLDNNLAHPNITSIHVLYDTSKDGAKSVIRKHLEECNVEITTIKGRPSYARCFELANELYPDQNVIIANADIYFDETLALVDRELLEHRSLALTRWDIRYDNTVAFHGRTGGSHDAWILRTPITVPAGARKILLGIQHCDIRIAFELSAVGHRVFNPCMSVKCFHLHKSDIRSYKSAARPTKGVMPLVITSLEPQDSLINTDLVIVAHNSLKKTTRIIQNMTSHMGHLDLQRLGNIHLVSENPDLFESPEAQTLKELAPHLSFATIQPSEKKEFLQTLAKQSDNNFVLIADDSIAHRSPLEMCTTLQYREQAACAHRRHNGRPDSRMFGDFMRRLNREQHITLCLKSDLARGRPSYFSPVLRTTSSWFPERRRVQKTVVRKGRRR